MASAKNVNIDTAYLTLVAILTESPLVENIQIWPWSGTNRVRLVEPMSEYARQSQLSIGETPLIPTGGLNATQRNGS